MDRRAGIALVALSATSFGCLALFARLALDNGVSRPMLLFLRFTIASLIMLAVLKLQRIVLPPREDLPKLMLLGCIYVGQAVCFFSALLYIQTSLASLMLYFYPVLVTILARIFLKERLTPTKLACLLLALVGSALTIGATGKADPVGLAFGFGSALFYSCYIVLGTRFLVNVDVIAASVVVMVTAATIFGGWALVDGVELPESAEGWFGVVGLAVIGTAVAISTFFAGLERVGPVVASTISALEPVVTVMLGAIFLSEHLGPLQIVGGIMIITATVVLARASDSPEPPQTSNPAIQQSSTA